MSGRRGAVAGALVALAVVAALALVGVFDGGAGDPQQDGRAGLPAVPLVGAQDGDASDDLGRRINTIYARYAPGVVFIQATIARPQESPFGTPQQGGVSTGTGFVIEEGLIVTNAHVVENAQEVALQLGENRLAAAELVGSDISTDLALLRYDTDEVELPTLPLGDVDEVEVGDPVVAIGNPFGLEDTITSGIVSALQRRIQAPNGFAIEGAIQTDAAVNPGNSGGPLIDAEGRVIGVNSQIATGGQTRANAGIAFAVPVSTVKRIVADLRDDGRVSRGFLGVQTGPVDARLAEQLGLGTGSGALVAGVVEGGPADRAGLRSAVDPQTGALLPGGDVITAVNGRPVADPSALQAAIGNREPGDTVALTVVRSGEERTERITLAPQPG